MIDLAYVAGIVDARGHIEVMPNRIRLRVTTKRLELLEWLANNTGVKVRLDERGYQRRACGEHCMEKHVHQVRQSAYWNVDGLRCAIILEATLPWLVENRPGALKAIRHFVWPANPKLNEISAQMIRLGWPVRGGE